MENNIIVGYQKTLKGLIADANTIDDMMIMAVYYTGRNLFKKTPLAKALEPLVYHMYHYTLDDYMYKLVQEMLPHVSYDTYYRGFVNGEWDPSYEVESIMEYCKDRPDFQQDVLEWYWVTKTIEALDFPIPLTEASRFFLRARELNKENNDFEGTPTFKVSKLALLHLWIGRERTDEETRAKWAMHIAILSIIGQKPYASTTSDTIKLRMFGFKNKHELVLALKDEKTKELYEKWTSRRRYDRMLSQLQVEGYIREFGERRRTFLTTKLTLEELVQKVASSSKKKQKEDLRDKKAQLRAKYMK